MKCNKQELINLASQSSNRFVKEGPLLLYERQDGILFKRQENSSDAKSKTKRPNSLRRLNCYGGPSRAASERWCRLRGNLLFYFKSREAWSEPAGVIILEIGKIQLDPVAVDGMWPFTLIMASGGGDHRLAAFSEAERDNWVQVLNTARHSLIQAKVKDLQNQLLRLTGTQFEQTGVVVTEAGEIPLTELSIACDNLRCDGHGSPPSPQANLQYLSPTSLQWYQVGSTESISNCSNPTFLVTLPLWSSMNIQLETRLRLIVNDVREALSQSHVHIGSCEFSVSTLVGDASLKKRFPLSSSDGIDVGFVTLTCQSVVNMSEYSKSNSNPQSPTVEEDNQVLCHRRTQSLPPRLLMELGRPPQGWIPIYFSNAITRTYRFHTGLGGDIVVHETMLETPLNNIVPSQLLQLWIAQEKDLVRELVALGEMVPSPWQQRMLQLLERHFRRIGDYTQALESVDASSKLFRTSVQKDKSTLQYCPVNLHLQRLWAQNSSLRKEGTFDCITVGAFTAIPHGFKGGGLMKLLKNFKKNVCDQVDDVGVAREDVQVAVKTLRHIQGAVKLLLGAVHHTDLPFIFKVVESLIKKVRSLTALLDSPRVGDALLFFEKNRLANCSSSATLVDFSLLPLRSMVERLVKDSNGIDSGFYSGTDEPEPLELTRINVEASLLTLAGKLQLLLDFNTSSASSRLKYAPGLSALLEKYQGRKEGSSNKPLSPLNGLKRERIPCPNSFRNQSQEKWADELSPCLSKLLTASQNLTKTLRLVHAIQRLKEEAPRSAVAYSLQHRRDVCFSQALTAAISGLIARINCNPIEPEFLVALSHIGVALGIEGLLTPYRTEAGMWSDMVVAIEDLSAVSFLLVPVSSVGHDPLTRQGSIPVEYLPVIQGTREALQVTIPVPTAVFSALPPNIAKQGLVEFRLVPMFFTVGINEQAILADKFGDMSAVFDANQQSYQRLESYHRRYQKLMIDYFPTKRLNEPKRTLSSIISQLQTELMATDKIQNIEIHYLAETAVRKMRGLRMTCCKSAKDRTGMAVTLEQTNILSDEFDLTSGEFLRSLHCMRSQGTRRENTTKNVGVNKFAFNRLQLMAFPALYRPPPGTFGNFQT